MAKKPKLSFLRPIFKTPLRLFLVVLVAGVIVAQVSAEAAQAILTLDFVFAGLMILCGWRPFKKRKAP